LGKKPFLQKQDHPTTKPPNNLPKSEKTQKTARKHLENAGFLFKPETILPIEP
jgi:hypothetical protein